MDGNLEIMDNASDIVDEMMFDEKEKLDEISSLLPTRKQQSLTKRGLTMLLIMIGVCIWACSLSFIFSISFYFMFQSESAIKFLGSFAEGLSAGSFF